MARIYNVQTPNRTAESYTDPMLVELDQLLSRLRQSLLHPSPERERRLRTSEYERARAEANLNYARTTLSRQEQNALQVKAPARRIELQDTLNHLRETLELLYDRLHDLRQIAVDDDDSSEGEDLLGEVVPTPSESMDSSATDAREDLRTPSETRNSPSTTPENTTPGAPPTTRAKATPEAPSPARAPTETTQTLRSRGTTQPPTSSSTAHSTARAALFATRRRPESDVATQGSTATTEAILDQQRTEQDALSESILRLAGALKSSSKQFASTLDADKDVVGQAGEGMEKTGRGMEATKGRMGMLRKMTEGKGWWGRMILYAWVYGLMLGLLVVVFVLPKLRF